MIQEAGFKEIYLAWELAFIFKFALLVETFCEMKSNRMLSMYEVNQTRVIEREKIMEGA